jgi:hypothetical protein
MDRYDDNRQQHPDKRHDAPPEGNRRLVSIANSGHGDRRPPETGPDPGSRAATELFWIFFMLKPPDERALSQQQHTKADHNFKIIERK